MAKIFIGLDIHKKFAQAAFIKKTKKGLKLIKEEQFLSTADDIRKFAVKQDKDAELVMEATTNTWAYYNILSRYIKVIKISNPLQTKAIAHAKVKTDKVDARILARLLASDFIPEVTVPEKKTVELRHISSMRSFYVKGRTMIKNRIHSILHRNLIHHKFSDLFSSPGISWLKELELDTKDRFELVTLLSSLDEHNRHIETINKKIAEYAYADDYIKILMTLPGIDYYTALAIISAIGDISRFPEPEKLVSYIGLSPSVSQSGDKCYGGRITKRGRSLARWVIVEAAQHFCMSHGPINSFYNKLKKKKGHNKAVVAVARKLTVIIWHMLKKRESYRYSIPRSTEEKFSRLRILVTGKRKKTGIQKDTIILKETEIRDKRGRRIKPLSQVCYENGLPFSVSIPDGEKKYLSKVSPAALKRIAVEKAAARELESIAGK